ncbi:Frataxin/CyaY [Arabidopsis suecica]|uniref:Frataxin/CyaY n=2 Tax=Arabidopsis suecica TaxID=45249 RepID=A0A8T1ZFB1_ARASU|nr:Frataxin/CyaY [Arabidopsis suecica]
MATASRFLRKLPRFLKLSPTLLRSNGVRFSSNLIEGSKEPLDSFWRIGSRISHDSFTTRSFSSQGPASVDYSSVLQEDEFHKLANFTINHLLEKIEDYGDNVQIDGFDIDYGNEVLTLKLGSLGTYVLNKQTPNRQIWMSSPVRFTLMSSSFFLLFGVVALLDSTGIVMLMHGFTGEPKQSCINS